MIRLPVLQVSIGQPTDTSKNHFVYLIYEEDLLNISEQLWSSSPQEKALLVELKDSGEEEILDYGDRSPITTYPEDGYRSFSLFGKKLGECHITIQLTSST